MQQDKLQEEVVIKAISSKTKLASLLILTSIWNQLKQF